MAGHGYSRAQRVGDLLRRELALMLLKEVKDPRVQGVVTVMEVSVSRDLGSAKVMVSVAGGEEAKAGAMAGLARAAGFLRRSLGRRLTIKRVPELRFELDRSLDYQEEMERLLRSVSQGGGGE